MQRPDHHKERKQEDEDELPLHTHADTVSVSSFQLPPEEDVSALRHGTVFIVIKTGFMTNNDRRLRGYVKTLLPPREIIKS